MKKHSSGCGTTREITRRDFLWLTSLSMAGVVTGCAIDPVTGKNQLMLVSEQQEIQMDKQRSPYQFSSDYGTSQDRALNNYVSQVGRKLVPNTHRPRMPYSFRVVNATYVNAYAFPGGSIATTRGILLKLNNEDELAGLLGHELGHVNARHTAEQLSKSQVTSLVIGGVQAVVGAKYSQYAELTETLGMLGAGLMLASYSRDNEREADDLGNRYMVQAGYNTQGFVGLMEMLNSLSKSKPGYAELLFSTHPMSQERYQTALGYARNRYQATKNRSLQRERYMDNTARVRAMKGAIEAMQKGETLMGKKQYDQAESYFKTALRQAPGDYTGLALMSKCQLAKEKYDQAERYAIQAKRAYPGEGQAYHLSGFAKLKRRKFSAAYQEFAAYDRVLPGNPGITFFKGVSQEGMGRREQAAAEYKKYLQVVQEGDNAKYAHQRLVEWGYIQKQ